MNIDLTFYVFYNLANMYHANGLHQEALNSYTIILKNKQYPQASRLRVNMGNIFFEQTGQDPVRGRAGAGKARGSLQGCFGDLAGHGLCWRRPGRPAGGDQRRPLGRRPGSACSQEQEGPGWHHLVRRRSPRRL